MNQQQLSEQARNTKQRSIEHFKFEEFSHRERRNRGKDTNHQGQSFAQGKKKNRQRKDGFARWSDYITYDSDEIENFDTDEESSYLKVDPDDSSESAYAEDTQKSLHNATATREKKSKIAQNVSYHRKDRKSELTKQLEQPISSFSNPGNFMKQTANSLHSPFSVPNISQIKKKEHSSKRNSQQFLLNLLQQELEEDPEELAQKKRLIQKQQTQQRQKRKKEDEIQLERIRYAQQKQRIKRQEDKQNRKKAEKKRQLQREKKIKQAQQRQKKKRQQRQKQRKEKQIQKKKKEDEKRLKLKLDKSKDKKEEKSSRASNELKQLRQKSNISSKDSRNEQQKRRTQQPQANKSKRVTINDRGRIKYPNDSISGQFQYILPQQFRRVQSSLKKPAIIQESDDEDLFKQEQVPMDIVDIETQKKLVQQAAKQDQKIQLKKAQDRLVQLSKKQTKKITKKKSKGKKAIRINNLLQTDSDQEFQGTKNQSWKQRQRHISVQKSTDKLQKPRKMLKNSQGNRIKEQIVNQQSVSSRPKRFRTNALRYWKNERPVYHAGMFLGFSNLSSSKFLEILQIEDYSKVMTGSVIFRSKEIKLKISLGPRQKFISRGIDQQIMKQYIHCPSLFDIVEILMTENFVEDDEEFIRLKVNNQMKKITSQPFRFRVGQRFSIENVNLKIKFKFFVTLLNSKNVSFTEDS